jgi:hypothetical protein
MGPARRARVVDQSILAVIFAISSAEKARKDSVRTLPSALRLRLSAVAERNWGQS